MLSNKFKVKEDKSNDIFCIYYLDMREYNQNRYGVTAFFCSDMSQFEPKLFAIKKSIANNYFSS